MSRLLLADDLTLYADGAELGAPPAIPTATPSEIPYKDGRFVGRVLTVAQDGTLTWVYNEPIPVCDARLSGAVLTVSEEGMAEWRYGSTGDDVVATDGAGIGILYYGTDVPIGGIFDGALWLTTRLAATPPPPPAPSTAPVMAAPVVTGTTVKLSWTAATGATAYEVRQGGVAFAQVSGLTTEVVMAENTSGDFTVAGVSGGGLGPVSNSVHAAVPNATPPPVSGLAPDAVSRGSLAFHWLYPDKPADWASYVVTASSGTVAFNPTAMTGTVTGAADNVNVTITVAARDAGGLTSPVATVVVHTPSAPAVGAPSAPTNLRVTRVGYSSADIAWTAGVGSTATQYSGDGVTWSGNYAGTTYTWGGRAESTRYSFFVRAVNASGVVSPTVGVAFDTLAKVNHYTYNTRLRSFGYGSGNSLWSAAGVAHAGSGILSTRDNWAGQTNPNNFLYACDYNTNTGPYAPEAYRYIDFGFTVNMIDVEQVFGYWGNPGTFEWQAWDTSNVMVQQGRTTYNGVGGIWCAANVKNAPSNKRIKTIRMLFYAGLGSPGVFKLREWAMQVRELTSTTPVYNPA